MLVVRSIFMNRQKAREYMMTVLFQMDANNDFDIDNDAHYLSKSKTGVDLGNQKEYCERIYSCACENIDAIDELISSSSRKWNIKRTPKTDLAIIRLAAIEIMYMEDIPDSVSINEAVELAKLYSEENAPSYINGILGSIARSKPKQ